MISKPQSAALLLLTALSASTMASPIEQGSSLESRDLRNCVPFYDFIPSGASTELILDPGKPGYWWADSLLDNQIHYRASVSPHDDKMELQERTPTSARSFNVFVLHYKAGANPQYRVEPGATCIVQFPSFTTVGLLAGVSVHTV